MAPGTCGEKVYATEQTDPAPVEDRLRDIQSLTDAALSRLDDHEFLDALLDRVAQNLSDLRAQHAETQRAAAK